MIRKNFFFGPPAKKPKTEAPAPAAPAAAAAAASAADSDKGDRLYSPKQNQYLVRTYPSPHFTGPVTREEAAAELNKIRAADPQRKGKVATAALVTRWIEHRRALQRDPTLPAKASARRKTHYQKNKVVTRAAQADYNKTEGGKAAMKKGHDKATAANVARRHEVQVAAAAAKPHRSLPWTKKEIRNKSQQYYEQVNSKITNPISGAREGSQYVYAGGIVGNYDLEILRLDKMNPVVRKAIEAESHSSFHHSKVVGYEGGGYGTCGNKVGTQGQLFKQGWEYEVLALSDVRANIVECERAVHTLAMEDKENCGIGTYLHQKRGGFPGKGVDPEGMTFYLAVIFIRGGWEATKPTPKGGKLVLHSKYLEAYKTKKEAMIKRHEKKQRA
jgi:hypothetical protein